MAQAKKTIKTVKTTRTARATQASRIAATTRSNVSKAKVTAVSRTKSTVTSARPKPRELKNVKSPLKADELKRFRSLLVEEQERLKLELQEIEERAARALEIEAAGELSDYDDHPADVASETFEREKDLAIAENVASLLVKIENAIAKLDRDTYGVCDICRRPIKRARLEAIPFATLCIECQGRVEIG